MSGPKPKNFDEMYEFYKRLAAENPWPTTTFGGHTVKGNPIERQMTPDELDRVIRAKAHELDWEIPEPVFDDDEVPF